MNRLVNGEMIYDATFEICQYEFNGMGVRSRIDF